MKKNLFFLMSCVIGTSIFSFAQITYESTDYASAGESYDVVNLTSADGFDFTQTGENFSWDFSSLGGNTVESYGYENPNNSPFKETWCQYHQYSGDCDSLFELNFNLGINLQRPFNWGPYSFTNPYHHLLHTDLELQTRMIGANVELGIGSLPLILEYDDPDVLFRFPLYYGATFNDTNGLNMDLSVLGLDLQITAGGTRNTYVEGWGSLNIRNHIFSNTLKVKSTLSQGINIYLEGLHTEVAVSETTYFWFDKDFGIPVLVVAGVEVGGTFIPNLITYVQVDTMSSNDPNIGSNNLAVYPNPTDGRVNLNLSNNEIIKSVNVYDQNGRRVSTSLDLTELPKGIYTLNVETTKRVYSEKVIRK